MSAVEQPRAHVTGWGRYAPAGVLTNADLERMVRESGLRRGSSSDAPPR